jgi:lysophospholipase L1-like esterase
VKNVILIGDSIRMGYQETVGRDLAGLADVWAPPDNGGATPNVLVHLHSWVLNRPCDVVHVNAGLHDLKTIWYGGREPVTPPDHYRRNVGVILSAIGGRTRAKAIWATTTPVRDDAHNANHSRWNDFCRYNEYVQAYNAAAVEVCRELGVPVNDLYAVAMGAGLDRIQNPDGVHFTVEGSEVLGKAAAGAILAVM